MNTTMVAEMHGLKHLQSTITQNSFHEKPSCAVWFMLPFNTNSYKLTSPISNCHQCLCIRKTRRSVVDKDDEKMMTG